MKVHHTKSVDVTYNVNTESGLCFPMINLEVVIIANILTMHGPQTLKNVMWFKERSVGDISLGGLLILVVIRTIQYNMTRMRDKYLHTNCLAALANMSAHFHSLHPYVSQRIVR